MEERPVALTLAQRRVLALGLDWLYQTEQPDDAIAIGNNWPYATTQPTTAVAHHGVYAPDTDGRLFQFIPWAWRGQPVIVVNARGMHAAGDGLHTANRLAPGELDALAAYLELLGYPVEKTWATSSMSGNVELTATAHPSLIAAAERYFEDCPHHQSLLCKYDDCSWYRDGAQALIRPDWKDTTGHATPAL